MNELSPRQTAFIKEYLICGSGAEAARRAGYAESTSLRAGEKLLKRPQIKAAIDAHRAEMQAKTGYSLEAAVTEINGDIAGAIAKGQYNAVSSLRKLKLQLYGLLIERAEMRVETVDITAALAEAQRRAARAIDGGTLRALPSMTPETKPAQVPDIFGD